MQLCLHSEYNVIVLFLVFSADELPDGSNFYPVDLEGVTPNIKLRRNEIVPLNLLCFFLVMFLPSFAVPVLLNFVIYSDFINNFHFVSK